MNGKEAVEFDEEGMVQFTRKRDQVHSEIDILGVPEALLPGGKNKQIIEARPFHELSVPMDVTCLLWIYWIPPDEPEPAEEERQVAYLPTTLNGKQILEARDDNMWQAVNVLGVTTPGIGYRSSKQLDDKIGSEHLVWDTTIQGIDEGDGWVKVHLPSQAEDDEPEEGMLFVCADPEQIPEEAKPIACTLSCPGAESIQIHHDGESFGPVAIRQSVRKPVGSLPDECLLAKVQFLCSNPPAGYRFRGRYPSPLTERTKEIGGCELSRLIAVPAVVGYLKPLGKAK
jgi:hypothetical protein